jgi:hypothetical protein
MGEFNLGELLYQAATDGGRLVHVPRAVELEQSDCPA